MATRPPGLQRRRRAKAVFSQLVYNTKTTISVHYSDYDIQASMQENRADITHTPAHSRRQRRCGGMVTTGDTGPVQYLSTSRSRTDNFASRDQQAVVKMRTTINRMLKISDGPVMTNSTQAPCMPGFTRSKHHSPWSELREIRNTSSSFLATTPGVPRKRTQDTKSPAALSSSFRLFRSQSAHSKRAISPDQRRGLFA
jgi:hypothetical protein